MKLACCAFAFLLSLAPAAFAAPVVFTAGLSGSAEDPPNASPGSGFATLEFDLAAHSFTISVDFQDLVGTTTAAHVHCCTSLPLQGIAGVATQVPTFAGFPLGVTAGSYDATFDTTLASTFNPAFVTANGGSLAAAEAALFDGLLVGRAYFNIHTAEFGAGEIRGFLVAAPEPEMLALLCGGLLATVGLRRRRR